jgi:hyperosmotically inducible protein
MKTDIELKQQVEDELAWDSAVVATHIGVEVMGRVVTLSGRPASYAEKIAAEKAAQRVAGVKAVVVEMKVHLPHDDVRTDEDIANAVRSILHWTVGLSESAVQIQVESGWVTLRGAVDEAYQSHVAARSISHMRGVTGVSNLIEVRAEVASEDIGDEIVKALRRHAEREAKHIEVTVREGTVTLNGRVGSYAERSAARGAAWSAPGVHAVVDNLIVE